MTQRSYCLVPLGWFLAFALYIVQACFLMKFLEEHTATNSNLYWICLLVYLVFASVVVLIVLCKPRSYAETDDEVWWVWLFWLIYIVLFMILVGMIFGLVADEVVKSETYGPNFLKAILCIAPALLVLVLQLVISPSFRNGVLALSVFAALDLFDGIEMLEIVLMQNEKENFDLNDGVEKCIIAFACSSFVLTSLGLARKKFTESNIVEERSNRGLFVSGCY